MELKSLDIFLYSVLVVLSFSQVSISSPSCIVFRGAKDDLQNMVPRETRICHIYEIFCAKDEFPSIQQSTEVKIMVCLSEKSKSCMFTWPLQGKGQYMILAVKEHDFMTGSERLNCFNISVPDNIDTPASVTALMELQPHEGSGMWIESALVLKSSSGTSAVLAGQTVYRNGRDNTCDEKDQCLGGQSLIVTVGQTTCHENVARTNVTVSTQGIRIRTLEVWADANRVTCSGLMKNCILWVDRLFGGIFHIQIRLTLANNGICQFIKLVNSKICGDPLVMSTQSDLSTQTELFPRPKSSDSSSLPAYVIVGVVFTAAIVTAVLSTLGVFACKILRRNGCPQLTPVHVGQPNNRQYSSVSYRRSPNEELQFHNSVEPIADSRMNSDKDISINVEEQSDNDAHSTTTLESTEVKTQFHLENGVT